MLVIVLQAHCHYFSISSVTTSRRTLARVFPAHLRISKLNRNIWPGSTVVLYKVRIALKVAVPAQLLLFADLFEEIILRAFCNWIWKRKVSKNFFN